MTIPKGVIGNGKIINEAGEPSSRHGIRVSVGVAYGSDVNEVIASPESVAEAHSEVCEMPAPLVRFRTFGESCLDFELLCWIEQPVDRGRMIPELNCAIYKRFSSDGIRIPFPQRDLHLNVMSKLDS